MAVDPSELATADQQDVAQTEAEVSGAKAQESESSFMNQAFRRAIGWFRGDDEDTDAEGDSETQADDEATKPKAGLSEDEIQERIRREAQSLKDRELLRDRRESAVQRADDGDFDGLLELADKHGDNAFALRELAKRGATYEAGQVVEARAKAEESAESRVEAITYHGGIIGPMYDQSVLEPLMLAVPEEARAGIIGEGIDGFPGRTAAVGKAIAAIRADAATKMLGDDKFVRSLLGDTSFRKELLANPVTNKQLRAYFRGELDEPDLNPGLDRGAVLERESDVMNAEIRRAAGAAIDRGPQERAAGAGARSRRGTNRDLLDDDDE